MFSLSLNEHQQEQEQQQEQNLGTVAELYYNNQFWIAVCQPK